MRARVRGERGAGEAVLGVDVRARRGGGRGALLGAAQLLAGRAHHAAGVEPVVISRPQPDLQTHTMERVVSNSTPLKLTCPHVVLCDHINCSHASHLELLAGVVAGVGVVEDEDVQPRVLARVVVAAGAPVLPLPHLEARVTCHKLSRGVTRCEVTWTQLRSSHMVSVWSKHLLPSPYDSSAKLRSSPGSRGH